MEEKEDFKSIMAKFHMKGQDVDASKSKKPFIIGNKPPLMQKPKPALVPKSPESEYLTMHPVAPWRELTKELSSSNLRELSGGQIGTSAAAAKLKGELATFERGTPSPADPGPRSPLTQIGLRKTFKEKAEKRDSPEAGAPQMRKAMDFPQHLLKTLSQNPVVNNVARSPPSKDQLPPKPLKKAPVSKPTVPRRKVLPNVKELGPKPAKPPRPPHVDLKRFMDARGLKTQVLPTNGKIPDCLKQKFETKDVSSPLQSQPRKSSTGASQMSQSTSSYEEPDEYDDVETVRPVPRRTVLSPPVPSKPKSCTSPTEVEDFYDDVGSMPNTFPPPPLQLCKSQELRSNLKNLIVKQRELEEKEFRKKFKFEGEIKVLSRMMVDPNAIIKKCGPYDLPHKRGDFLDVIQYMGQDKVLCRNLKWKFGYIPKISLLSIERDIYDDVEVFEELYDDIELITKVMPPVPPKTRLPSESEVYALKQANEKNLKKIKKEEKEEKDIRKKFKLEGEIKVLTQMMVDPNARIKRGGGKYLSHKRGEILDLIQRTSLEKLLCRNSKGKYGYVPRLYMLQVEREVYDYVDMSETKTK